MPIPGGNAPVRPIRVVINTGGLLPSRERWVLADWISQTQHPRTRIRLSDAGRTTRPLTARTLRTPGTRRTRPVGVARAWLTQGAQTGASTGWITLGKTAPTPFKSPRVLTPAVTVRAGDARVRQRIASAVARDVMTISRQQNLGTTSP